MPHVLGERIDKTHPGHEHWEDYPLTQQQIEYAANDAYAHLELYRRADARRADAAHGGVAATALMAMATTTNDDADDAATADVTDDATNDATNGATTTDATDDATNGATTDTTDTATDAATVVFNQRDMPLSPAIAAAIDEVAPTTDGHGEADDARADGTALEIDLLNDTAAAGPFADAKSQLASAHAALLRAARQQIEAYSRSDRKADLHLPAELTADERKECHVHAASLGLAHRSVGDEHDRHLVISKWTPATPALASDGAELIGSLVMRGTARGRVSAFSEREQKWDVSWEGNSADEAWDIAQLNEGMRVRFECEHGNACEQSRAALASARSFAPVGGFSEQDVATLLAEIKDGWEHDAIKYDVRHWLGSLFLVVSNKHSVLFPMFANAMSDAVFKIVDGEYARVRAHLGKLKMSDEQIRALRRKYWRRHAMWRSTSQLEGYHRLCRARRAV